jgi:hypothetical protein
MNSASFKLLSITYVQERKWHSSVGSQLAYCSKGLRFESCAPTLYEQVVKWFKGAIVDEPSN